MKNSKNKHAEVWSRPNCKWCDAAISLLSIKGYTVRVCKDWTIEQLHEVVPGAKTVPQIFADDMYIGNYEKLVRYLDA